MHVHVSVLDGLIVGSYIVITLYALKLVSVKYPESAVGKAASFIN